jgi:hypothetical protein
MGAASSCSALQRVREGERRRYAGALGWVFLVTMLWASGVVIPPGTDILGPIINPLMGSLKAGFIGGGSLAIVVLVAIWSLKKCWQIFGNLIGNDRVRDMTWDYYAGRIADMNGAAGGAVDGFYGDPMQGHTMADYGDTDDSGWSQSQEYEDEMNATGPDHAAYEQSSAEQDSAASSYLARYKH